MAVRGCFITLEGGEGAGKTTHQRTVCEYLEQQGIGVLATREPGGTEVAEAIRTVLLDPALPAMDADTELLLMFAARNEHITRKIIPALEQGLWVVCDRFTDATYAYQGYGRGLSLARIEILENWVQGSLKPDHTLLFDLDVVTGLQRVQQRSQNNATQTDRFEREQEAFYHRIRQGYLTRAAASAERFYILDAAHDMIQVQQSVRDVLGKILQQRGGWE